MKKKPALIALIGIASLALIIILIRVSVSLGNNGTQTGTSGNPNGIGSPNATSDSQTSSAPATLDDSNDLEDPVVLSDENSESRRLISIYDIGGSCTVIRNGDSQDAFLGMDLFDGDIVEVSEGGFCRIKFDEYKRLYLDEETRIEITASGDAENSNTSVFIERGTVLTNILEKLSPESSFTVVTANTVMYIRGTSGYTVVKQVGIIIETGFIGLEGTVHFQPVIKGGTIRTVAVSAGEGYSFSSSSDQLVDHEELTIMANAGSLSGEEVTLILPENAEEAGFQPFTLEQPELETIREVIEEDVVAAGEENLSQEKIDKLTSALNTINEALEHGPNSGSNTVAQLSTPDTPALLAGPVNENTNPSGIESDEAALITLEEKERLEREEAESLVKEEQEKKDREEKEREEREEQEPKEKEEKEREEREREEREEEARRAAEEEEAIREAEEDEARRAAEEDEARRAAEEEEAIREAEEDEARRAADDETWRSDEEIWRIGNPGESSYKPQESYPWLNPDEESGPNHDHYWDDDDLDDEDYDFESNHNQWTPNWDSNEEIAYFIHSQSQLDNDEPGYDRDPWSQNDDSDNTLPVNNPDPQQPADSNQDNQPSADTNPATDSDQNNQQQSGPGSEQTEQNPDQNTQQPTDPNQQQSDPGSDSNQSNQNTDTENQTSTSVQISYDSTSWELETTEGAVALRLSFWVINHETHQYDELDQEDFIPLPESMAHGARLAGTETPEDPEVNIFISQAYVETVDGYETEVWHVNYDYTFMGWYVLNENGDPVSITNVPEDESVTSLYLYAQIGTP